MYKSYSSRNLSLIQKATKIIDQSNFLPKINERRVSKVKSQIKASMIGSKIPLINPKFAQNQSITGTNNNDKSNQKNNFVEQIALTERVKYKMTNFIKNSLYQNNQQSPTKLIKNKKFRQKSHSIVQKLKRTQSEAKPKKYQLSFIFQEQKNNEEQPYYLQGDFNLELKLNKIRRNKLKNSIKIRNGIEKFINTCFILEKHDCLQFEFIDKYNYMQSFFRIALILRRDLRSKKEKWPMIRRLVEQDWRRDLQGNIIMTKEMLVNALFELADIWTPEIDEEQYVEFFETLKVKYIMPIEEIGETAAKKISSFQMMF